MATYIITGNYTASAMKGMVSQPSDREAAVRPLIEGAGGKMIAYYATMGDNDFLAIFEQDANQTESMIAALLVAGASESVCNLKTVQAFTSAEFKNAQGKASAMMASFKPSNQ